MEDLARKKQVQPPQLIEEIIVGYLNSTLGGPHLPEPTSPSAETVQLAGLRELFRWDEERGSIVFASANKRVFILNAHSWDGVEQDLFAKLLKGAAPILTEMGTAYGRAAALDYRSITSDPEAVASYFEYLGLTAGWGKITVGGDLTRGSKITIKVKGCVFCASRNMSMGRAEPCHFIIGVCKGIVDTVYGGPHSVHESKCFAKGNELCEIVVTATTGAVKTTWPPSGSSSIRP
ncbi:MAG: hypothetical protein OK456_02005 [Thaumarchaeota archaeon]|nr:hypothetical protein [Nitrososphaerota archaeon]